MRVALLSRNALPGDAIGQQVAAKQAYFQQRAAEVRVYLQEEAGCRKDVQPHVAASARQLWKDDAQREYLLSCDFVLAEFGSHYPLLDVLPALRGQGPRILIEYHGVTPLEFADRALQVNLEAACRQRALAWCADAVLVHSRFAAEELQRATGLPTERMHQAPCWIQPAIEPDQRLIETLRRRHALQGCQMVLYVGRFARNKQPEKLIEALLHLDDQVVAVFVGSQNDVYHERLQRCKALAQELGVAHRVRFVGHASPDELAAWYALATVLALPSQHECFGMPIVEAMQQGTSVVGSTSGSLPEVIQHSGLLADAGSVAEWARQLKRFLQPTINPSVRRIALVTHRFGTHFAGGAEQSLRLMATALTEQGYAVEVFTTCNDDASRWANTLPEGASEEAGFTVHRFPLDAHLPALLSDAYQRIVQGKGNVAPEVEAQYLNNSLGSQALIEALAERRDDFAAILTGPYLFKLTYDIATRFGEQVLLAPCFHDEPLVQLAAFRQAYRQVGGLLFHTSTEARWSVEQLGIAQPRHAIVGTVLGEDAIRTSGQVANEKFGTHYLVYCGRYCPEKGLDRLLEYFEQLQGCSAVPIKLVCMGQGPMKLPRRPWLIDAGYVSEQEKRDILSGALALVNLSRHESLSIVVLESWALGVPVIVDAGCAVLCEQVARCEGGATVHDATELTACVERWLACPQDQQKHGSNGKQLVAREYRSMADYGTRLKEVVESMHEPLAEIARQQGLEQSASLTPMHWDARFGQVLEQVEHTAPAVDEPRFGIEVLTKKLEVMRGSDAATVTLQLRNLCSTLLPATGPLAGYVQIKVRNGGKKRVGPKIRLPLGQALMPGQEQLLVAAVDLPSECGKYRISIQLRLGDSKLASAKLALQVLEHAPTLGDDRAALGPLLHSARQALAEARLWEVLPEDYQDVTEGNLANLKKMLKQKLLNNFRKGYVDVAFRQQSTLNRKLIAAMSLMLESVSSHDVAGEQAQMARRLSKLEQKLKQERRRRRALQKQLAALAPPADALLEGNPT